MKDWAEIRKLIVSLQEKRREQERLLNVLTMYCDVAEQGIDPEEVVSYSFDVEGVTIRQVREMAKRANIGMSTSMFGKGGKPDYYGTERLKQFFYNVVHLRSGEDVVLQTPILRRQ